MKIITFSGGLGNQIFEYANYVRLKEKFPKSKFYAFYPSKALKGHNGLEIDKDFYVDLPKEHLFYTILGYFFFYTNKLFFKLRINQPFVANRFHQNDGAIYHSDWFGDKKFVPENFFLKYRINNLSQKNCELLDKMRNFTTIAIHIRRGDFLKNKNIKKYGGICTNQYYKKAINSINQSVEKPLFIFFSDDTKYVSDNFNMQNMCIVDWNHRKDSYLDMYLMSQCDYMVLANSTFSYWAARFNSKVKKVFCPTKWQNEDPVDISLQSWIQIDNNGNFIK